MKTIVSRAMAIIVALCAFIVPSAKEKTDSLHVLFIGNSYTFFNDMYVTVSRIAAENPAHRLAIAYKNLTPGGCSFARHLTLNDEIDVIKKGGWDYVVMQEQSSAPSLPSEIVAKNTYRNAHLLDSIVHKYNPKAQVIFYMTWGHKFGTQNPTKGYPLPDTYEGMQMRLINSYLEMAYQNNAWCAPVGMAWQQMRRERPYVPIYNADASHPSAIGSYLAANVIYATILQKPYTSNYIADIDPELAEYIQQLAQNTVLNNLRLQNIVK